MTNRTTVAPIKSICDIGFLFEYVVLKKILTRVSNADGILLPIRSDSFLITSYDCMAPGGSMQDQPNSSGHSDIVKLIMKKGADFNPTDISDEAILVWAAQNGKIE